jgi:hypothetical protein
MYRINLIFSMQLLVRNNSLKTLVLISIVDLILNYSMDTSAGGASAVSALRAFRLMRIFKLAKSWT